MAKKPVEIKKSEGVYAAEVRDLIYALTDKMDEMKKLGMDVNFSIQVNPDTKEVIRPEVKVTKLLTF